ncbi:MAG: pyridoxal phosphate-dependent aminotransferase [Janthinobacterium lividum]
MHYAARSDFGPQATGYGSALQAARANGTLLDLTVSNPSRCGFHFPETLLPPLSRPESLTYDPHPLGMRRAREAVADMYREGAGVEIAPEHILLTGSTSEAYSYLLRLLGEPGDAVLVPSPSYPLFDLLARLHDVERNTYPLVYHDGWQIDPASLDAAVTERTRALIVIHPNNPTGHFCSAADRKALLQCARRHGLPLIVDEVFLEYPVEGDPARSFVVQEDDEPVLTFVLGGLSKLLCLPQMKLAWTVVRGAEGDVAEAMHRLEIIADTFLSVGTPPQLALPDWLAAGQGIRQQVTDRVRSNLAWLDGALVGTVVSRLTVEAGWTAVLRVPAHEPDEDLATRLLQEHDVAVHPGSLYGFAARGWLVVSLLTPQETFAMGIARLLQTF